MHTLAQQHLKLCIKGGNVNIVGFLAIAERAQGAGLGNVTHRACRMGDFRALG
jgi:hypothetical protein